MNVEHPGPSVGGNSEIHERIVDVLFGCLAQALPERVAAATGGSSCNFLFGGVHPATGGYYANYHIDGCGWGGKDTGDGNDTQCPINGNCRNTPVEVFETRYPWITKTYRIASGSGGHGRHKGGCGSVRVIEALAPEITVSSFMDRHEVRAWGLFGGGEGESGKIRIRKKGDEEWRTFSEVYGTPSPNKFADIQIQGGDEIIIASPGGGGYGHPEERDPAYVLEDIQEGFLSPEEARDVYAVALIEREDGNWRVDDEETERLRDEKGGC